jgi:phosphoribosylglycinamide formyltransferase-1
VTSDLSIAVLLSGSGRTLVNLAASIGDGRLPRGTRITAVIASKACLGCDRARELGIEPRVMPGVIAPDQLESAVNGARFIVLAGYLKLIRVPAAYRHRIVNIHPALLPSFGGHGMYGHHVHEAVLHHGCKVSGCTVHLVDDEYDRGPILAQRTCPVREDDTPDTLAARVFAEECIAYPAALSALLTGRVRVSPDGRRATIAGAR